MVRWAKVKVKDNELLQTLGHREIIPGFLITNDEPTYLKIFDNDAEELRTLIKKGIYYGLPEYDPKYDLNADGFIDSYDYYLLQKYIDFMYEHYKETEGWLLGY